MSCLTRFLVATGCIAAAASAVHAQCLPGDVRFDAALVSPAPLTYVMGAGPAVGGPPQSLHPGSDSYSATAMARSFYLADANHDGDLSQGEARRAGLTISSFNEMDRNNDGVLSRGEFEDALQ